MKFSKLLFFTSMITGTLIAISSYSWLSMWLGLEINLLSIIPIMNSPSNIYPSESALKYFITQALASSVLLFSIIMKLNIYEFTPRNSYSSLMLIMNSALLTKLGAAPFHTWFPEVMEGLNWENSLVMLTWQKIAPMILVMYNLKPILFMSSIIIISAMIGGLMGINQISFRKIMAYSSINHIGWMLASMLSLKTVWLMYFTIYTMISVNIIIIFKQLNIFYIKQMINSMSYNKTIKFFLVMNFLSLGGLPPFIGFLPKWLIINNMVTTNLLFTSMILITSTLITLFFYLQITFSALMISHQEVLIYKESNQKNIFMVMNFLSLGGLMFSTLLFSLT